MRQHLVVSNMAVVLFLASSEGYPQKSHAPSRTHINIAGKSQASDVHQACERALEGSHDWCRAYTCWRQIYQGAFKDTQPYYKPPGTCRHPLNKLVNGDLVLLAVSFKESCLPGEMPGRYCRQDGPVCIDRIATGPGWQRRSFRGLYEGLFKGHSFRILGSTGSFETCEFSLLRRCAFGVGTFGGLQSTLGLDCAKGQSLLEGLC